MHTIEKQRGEECWTVGYKAADCEWTPLRDFHSREEAERFAHYLNGGDNAEEQRENLTAAIARIEAIIRQHHS